MSEPVAELFAELGFKVDKATLDKANKSIEAIAEVATRAVALVDKLGAAFDKMGAKSSKAGAKTKGGILDPSSGHTFKTEAARQSYYKLRGKTAPELPSTTAEGPALPQGYNKGVAEAKAAMIRAQRAAADKAQAKSELTGPKDAALGPSLPPNYNKALAEAKADIVRKQQAKELAAQARKELGLVEPPTKKTEGWLQSLQKVKAVATGIVAVFGARGVLNFASDLAESSVQLDRNAKTLGLTTRALEQLQYAASQSGVSESTLFNSLKTLQNNAQSTKQWSSEQILAFRRLGVTVSDSSGKIKPMDQLLGEVADRFKAIEDPAKRNNLVMKVFGGNIEELAPLLERGSEGIAQLRQEAEDLGGVMNKTLLANAKQYEASLKRFEFAFKGVKNAIGNFLLPILTRLASAFTTFSMRVSEVAKRTKLFETLLAVGLFVSLLKIVKVLQQIGVQAIWTWVKGFAPLLLVVALIAGVTVVLEDLYQTLTGGKGQLAKWLDEWQGLGTTSEFVKSIAAGLDSIITSVKQLANSPIDKIKELFGDMKFFIGTDLDAATNERANRPLATGRGVGAGAQSSLDIPRAEGRGLNAKANVAFGQSSASILKPASAGTNSPTIIVNAPTDKAADIGRAVKKALDKHTNEQNSKLRNALVPRAPVEAAP